MTYYDASEMERIGPHPQLADFLRQVLEQNLKILQMNERIVELGVLPPMWKVKKDK